MAHIDNSGQVQKSSNSLFNAKSVTLPSFEINHESYQMVNQKFKYPGLLEWNDVTVDLYETGDMAKRLLLMLQQAGYSCPGLPCNSGIQKGAFNAESDFFIEQLRPSGKAVQTFQLRNWYIKSANFGEMRYDGDDILSVSMTIGYDCALLVQLPSLEEINEQEN